MRDFLTALIECSASMSVLALALMALTPLLSKRYAAKWIYYAWFVVTVGLIIPFRFRLPMGFVRADAVPAPLRQALPASAGNAVAAAVQTAAGSQAPPAVPWTGIVFALWLAGAAAFLLFHGVRHARFLRTAKRWSERPSEPLLAVLENVENGMGIARRVELRVCSCISSPMMIGFRTPVILLPGCDFSTEELLYLLRHELVHFKRKDLWFKSLVILATAIHWFNPVAYLAARAISLQCEISCDAQVVSGTGLEGRRRYGETILEVVRRRPKVRTAFSTNFYAGKQGMKKRIFSIMDTKKKKIGIALLCLILVGTLGTGTALAVGGGTEAVPAVGSRTGSASAVSSGPSSSQAGIANPIRTIAGQWAEAVKRRDGKAQYALLSPKCQSAVYGDYSSEGWATGTSSPWVESYEISAAESSATVTYRYAASTGFAGFYEQTLSFVEQNGKYFIDSFSEPKEIPAAGSGSGSSDPKVTAFLNSADGSSFQQTANSFVKSYLIGDVRAMERNLSNPDSKQNDFNMEGKTVNWKSLTLKLDPKDIGENTVSAEYEIALARSGGFDDLASTGSFKKFSFTMEKVDREWKVISFAIEK